MIGQQFLTKVATTILNTQTEGWTLHYFLPTKK